MDPTRKRLNKDLVLREQLALERTHMANDRTLLSFIRTSMYFAIAGITVNNLLDLKYGLLAEIIFWACSIIILAIGFIKFYRQRKKLKESERHIGNYQLERDEDVE
jgi:putative membrane protein